ncbi:hypothetical protein K2X85_20985 [bacterium]|nr:hypothetical protein [bacterium]
MRLGLFLSALCLILIPLLGCEEVQVRAKPPTLPTGFTAHNDLVLVEYRGMMGPRDNQGVIAASITNKSDQPITLRGEQGSPIPTKNNQRAWLAYKGSEDLKRFLATNVLLEFQGPQAQLTLDPPSAGEKKLSPGETTTVLVAYALTGPVEELSFDLSPIVSELPVHDAKGELRTLYLTVPVQDRPSVADRAKEMIKNTRLGINLTSDDVMN